MSRTAGLVPVMVRNFGRASVLSLLLPLSGYLGFAQGNSTALSPSEAYKAALLPLNAARTQQDNLTDADKFAIGIGTVRASRDCLALSANTLAAVADDEKELLALGQLCLFGQQYEQARAALTKYLALSQPKMRKLALVLLLRAHIGLDQPGSAAAEVYSLLHDYAYDAQIHFAIDQVIDASEGSDTKINDVALHLCATQNAVTLPLLASGRTIDGEEIKASPSVVFADAIRCAALAESSGKPVGQDIMRQLTAIAQQPSWVGTADHAPMQAALARQAMVGARVPLNALHGHALSNSNLVPRIVQLTRGTVLLIPFTLWSPSAPSVARDLAKAAAQYPIYAITSWAVNTGSEDAPSNQILTALRSWQKTLPPRVSILILPDGEFSALHADSFPAAVVIRDGIVRSNSVVTGVGAERVLLGTLVERGKAR